MAAPLSPQSAKALLDSVDYILLDIDGVLWSGDHVFDGVPETLEWLRGQGKQVRFLSNNATMSRKTMAQKFTKKGLQGIHTAQLYTSAYAAALQLKKDHHGRDVRENIFVVGMEGLHDEIRSVLAPGYITYGLELNKQAFAPSALAKVMTEDVLPMAQSGRASPAPTVLHPAKPLTSLRNLNCTTVVAGLDFDLNMCKLAVAGLCLQQGRRVRYIATNEDPQLPVGKEGLLLPGAGCVIQALSTVAGREPDVVCGKPHLNMATLLFERERVKDPRRCLMIGDRLSTDIAFGNNAGCQTLLVLTGCEGMKDVAAAQALGTYEGKLKTPHFVADSLNALRLLAIDSGMHSKL